MATLTIEASVHLDFPPDVSFGYVTDPAKMNRWVTNVLEAAWEGAGGYEPGARYAIRYRWGGKENRLVHEVVSAEPGRWFEFAAVEGPFPIHGRYEFVSEDHGARFSYRQIAMADSPLASIMFRFFGWLTRPMMARQLRRDLEALAAAIKVERPERPAD
jgi:uncharacterized protein YndB with AHSA1/START domain